MNYRPQFAFKSPADCEEQRCVYSFDSTNTPLLNNPALAPGANISRIPLELDKDADFYLRGISTTDPTSGFPAGRLLQFRLEDPKGHPLSDMGNVADIMNYEFAALYSSPLTAAIVTLDNADDYGVYCQAGSRLYLHVHNNATVGTVDLTNFVLNLHGVKRYSGDRCAS